MWQKAARTDTAEAYEAFAIRCPRHKRFDDAKQMAVTRRCDTQWQDASNKQTLDGFEAFVETCAIHVELSAARGRIAAIRTKPLDGISGVYSPNIPVPRDRLSDSNKVQANKCEGGDGLACGDLGYRFRLGDGAPKDPSWEITLYSRACALNDPYACGNIGIELGNKDSKIKDISRSAILKKIGCDLGARHACTSLGVYHAEIGNIDNGGARLALKLFEEGCDQGKINGDANGCFYASIRYEAGLGASIARDTKKALQLAEAGLRLDPKYKAIVELRDRLRPATNQIGFSTSADGTTSASIPGLSPIIQNLATHCITQRVTNDLRGGPNPWGAACSDVGVAYETGKGAPQSLEDALVFFERSCNAKHASGCYNFARIYQVARGETADFGTALVYLEKACNLEFIGPIANACADAAELLANGSWGVTADRSKAATLVRQGLQIEPTNGRLQKLGSTLGLQPAARKSRPWYPSSTPRQPTQ
jgi:TPR repeat protein